MGHKPFQARPYDNADKSDYSCWTSSLFFTHSTRQIPINLHIKDEYFSYLIENYPFIFAEHI